MERFTVGRKLVFRDEALAAVHAIDAHVGGALGPIEVIEAGRWAYRVAVRIAGVRLTAVMPNVTDGLPRDLAPFLTRALEAAGQPIAAARDGAGADPFDHALVLVPADEPEAWVVDDADGWRVSGVPALDLAPVRERFNALLDGEGVVDAVRRWLGRDRPPDLDAIGMDLAGRRDRLKITGFGEVHGTHGQAMCADGTLDDAPRIRFRPASQLADVVRRRRAPGRIAIDGRLDLPRAEIAGLVLWATAVRDVLIVQGAAAAPGIGLFFVEDRPAMAWTHRSGRTVTAPAGPHVRFTADAPSGTVVAGPGMPLPTGSDRS